MRFFKVIFILIILAGVGWWGYRSTHRVPVRDPGRKVVVIGFDGADPRLCREYMDKGLLPNLSALAREGEFKELDPPIPSMSPVSWSSFAVGGDPGQHGVFDFVTRRPEPVSYFPVPESFVGQIPPKFVFGLPVRMPKAINLRGGTAFWDYAAQDGIKTALMLVPVTFAPPELPNGVSVAGLGVPDLCGTQATYFFVTNDPGTLKLAKDTEFGGKIAPLAKEGDRYVSRLLGPRSPIWKQEKEKLEKKVAQLKKRLNENGLDRSEKMTLEEEIRDLERAVKPAWEKERDRLEEKLAAAQARMKDNGLSESQRDRASKETERIKRSLKSFIPRDEHLSMPIEVRPQLGGQCAVVKIDEEERLVTVGTWSDWYRVKFDVTPLISVHGICKALVRSVTPHVSVYISPIEISPEKPPVSICHPGTYCKELVREIGLFKTRGWEADSAALKEGFIDERAFMNDIFEVLDKQLEMTLKTLEKDDWSLFVSVFSSTDRVSHMMWRLIDPEHPMYDAKLAEEYGDSIEKTYIKMDEMVGEIWDKIDAENTDFYVISDHGFRSFRNGVNLNTWLSSHGPGGDSERPFMSLRGPATRQYNLTELFGGNTDFFQMKVYDPILETTRSEEYVDWEQTKAFALGLATVYVNLEGRESRGVVKRSDYDAVCDELIRGLENLFDPQTGAKVVRKVYRGSEIFHGPYANRESVTFPDLVVGFEEGYRVGWQSTLGGISEKIITPNAEKWSGDHCGVDPSLTTGILFSNRKTLVDRPRMIDMAPTILASLGVKHREMQGIDLKPTRAESE